MTSTHEITQLLVRWSDGQEDAERELMRLVVPEMRKLARRCLRRERQNHTLQPTALVNEAYIRLVDQRTVQWHDRLHFFSMAATIMRHILVDYARRKVRAKRGGVAFPVSFDESFMPLVEAPRNLLALNDALDDFARIDPRKAKVVELRFFGGMNVEETAVAMKLSPNTIIRDWSLARAWLLRQMSSHESPGQ